jgi:uncharacterized protein
MKAFVEYVVKALVDFPDQVNVNESTTDRMIVYELKLNQSDIGKVIGKQGRTIQALRTLVNNASIKTGKRATLEIIEEKPFEKPAEAQASDSSQGESPSQTEPPVAPPV